MRSVSSVNLLTREIAIKVVYYGPGLGGKTSSLQFIHRALKPDSRGQLVSLATGVDRTLYFDFLPLKLPKLRGFSVRVQLYTVPGQVHYNSTRKLVLTGADAVVFVADSQRDRAGANVESLENLAENLREQGLSLKTIPFVLQYNKRDAPDALAVADLAARLNPNKAAAFETIATKGIGIFDALKSITSQVLNELRRRGSMQQSGAAAGGSTGDTGGIPAPIPSESSSGTASMFDARPRRAPTSQPFPAPDESQAITLGSLGEVADAIEKLAPTDARTTSGTHRMPSGTPARALSDLVAPGSARDALVLIETDLERGDWAGAVKHANAAFRDVSTRLAGSLATNPQAEGPALAALLTGLPASRFLRFREASDRVANGGAVSSADAMFALFFLCDFALRTEEIRR
jgi:mutual gliding-motility protein MglA